MNEWLFMEIFCCPVVCRWSDCDATKTPWKTRAGISKKINAGLQSAGSGRYTLNQSARLNKNS